MATATPKKAEHLDEVTGEIVKYEKASQELQSAQSWEDAARLMGENIAYTTEFGDGYALLDEKGKATLVGVPFVVTAFNLNLSKEYGGDFASVRLITKDNRKLVFNDGGVGIVPFLKDFLFKTQRNYGLVAEQGLRVSEYETEVEGKTIKAKTFYFDTSVRN